MPKYLAKIKYTPEGMKALRQSGAASRLEAGKMATASVGGTMDCFYFAFGEYDVYGIMDLPDDEAAASIALAASATGLLSTSITKLLTAAQVDDAFRRTVDYRPPGT